ncbi:DUF1653 domain-containing protein [Amphritea japonica]|uniref:DUF1653 domain-containing protein n=1 Tax=Amphritea japonica ATCC BAA-1530 TaxID=1278309 RepID=A0A7R6PBH0_9GAMM|nr:DUF1653 domain-containing protein [Amphritea japonica]BBB26423.1 conserved hypothetical protein [Amphritea japonica ATCC BAA-1530]
MTLQTGLYKHYKGSEYRVLHLARHSETEEWLVVYQQCYGDEAVWVRPLTMFTEQVTISPGNRGPRFALVKAD